MDKIKVYCVHKVRDGSGNIKKWIMGDMYGDKMDFNREEIKKLLKDKKYDVVNLQISADGKIVDKAVPEEKSVIDRINRLSKSNNIYEIFDGAYGVMQKMGLITIMRNPNGKVKMTGPFERLNPSINIDELTAQFESYIMNKFHTSLLKVDSINNRTGRRYIQYGIGYTEDYPCPDEIRDAESVSHYTIKCNAPNGKKVIGRFKTKSGQIIEDAYLGTIAYDSNNKEAVEWANKRIKELESHLLGKGSVNQSSSTQPKTNKPNLQKQPVNNQAQNKSNNTTQTPFRQKVRNFIRRFIPFV